MAIGEERAYSNPDEQDIADVLSLYATLEEEIVPLFYDRRDAQGVPHEWLTIVKESIASLTPQFSMSRMVKEYTSHLYVPAQEAEANLMAGQYHLAKDLAAWKRRIHQHWGGVRIEAERGEQSQSKVGQPLTLVAHVPGKGAK